jgi:hypothetical protein
MERLHYSIIIDAPRETVWDVMLDEETFRMWSDAFAPGSHYIGSWNPGSEIQFLAPEENGVLSGMYSRIKEKRQNGHIIIEHLGTIRNGVKEDPGDKASEWAGAQEIYTLNNVGQKTELLIDVDTPPEFKEMLENSWPEALQKLKKLAEEQSLGTFIEDESA